MIFKEDDKTVKPITLIELQDLSSQELKKLHEEGSVVTPQGTYKKLNEINE